MKRITLFFSLFSLLACMKAQIFNSTQQPESTTQQKPQKRYPVMNEKPKNARPAATDSQQHAYVDMGLPSGTLWARANIGASIPLDAGDYFAWGESLPKETYTWGNNKYGIKNPDHPFFDDVQLTKYCTRSVDGQVDNLKVLEPMDDAATQNWGSPWRTPTREQWNELMTNCKWKLERDSKGNNFIYIKAKNGNVMTLPCAEYMDNNRLSNFFYVGDNFDKKLCAYYWSSTLDTGENLDAVCLATNLTFRTAHFETMSRRRGMPIRPVRAKLTQAEIEGRSNYDNDITDETKAIGEMLEDLPSAPHSWADKTEEARFLLYRPVPDYEGAIKLLKEAANHDDSNAAWMLAQIYLQEGKNHNLDLAWVYASKSSGLGNPIGTYWLAVLYDNGEGSYITDPIERVNRAGLLYKDAQKGLLDVVREKQQTMSQSTGLVIDHAFAFDILGRIVENESEYLLKNEKDKNKIQEIREKGKKATTFYYEKAADMGCRHAQVKMGDMMVFGSFNEMLYDVDCYYIDGSSLNLKKNDNAIKALDYYRKGAKQGSPHAQNMVGVMLKQMKPNDSPLGDYAKEASNNFEYIQHQPTPYGLYNMGYCYEYGFGVEKDIIQANKYYKYAGEMGSLKGQEKYESLQTSGNSIQKK